jgi:hypothetical protein
VRFKVFKGLFSIESKRQQVHKKRTKSFIQIKIPPAIIDRCAIHINTHTRTHTHTHVDAYKYHIIGIVISCSLYMMMLFSLASINYPFFKSIGFFELSGHPYISRYILYIYVTTKQTFDLYEVFLNTLYFLGFITREE